MKYKLSPSTLNLFKECKRCFWLKFNKGIKRPNGIFPSLPSGMDRDIKTYFDSFRNSNNLPPEVQSITDAKLFDIQELLIVWRNNFKGITWTNNEGHTLRGAVDDILVRDNKLIVLDYKTRGYDLKPDTVNYYKQQLSIYNLLLRKNSFETEDHAYLLFYIPHTVTRNGLVHFHTQLVRVDYDIKEAENVFNEAIKCLEGSEPKCTCEYCKGVV